MPNHGLGTRTHDICLESNIWYLVCIWKLVSIGCLGILYKLSIPLYIFATAL